MKTKTGTKTGGSSGNRSGRGSQERTRTGRNGSSARKRYSYIREPFCRDGWFCFGLGLIAALLTIITAVCSIKDNGCVPAVLAAAGISALLIDIAGMIFVVSALRERHKNQLFTAVGGILLAAVLIAWAVIIVL